MEFCSNTVVVTGCDLTHRPNYILTLVNLIVNMRTTKKLKPRAEDSLSMTSLETVARKFVSVTQAQKCIIWQVTLRVIFC